MTRKDFIVISIVLKTALLKHQEVNNDAGVDAIKLTISLMATSLAVTNPRFDEERFIKACGIE